MNNKKRQFTVAEVHEVWNYAFLANATGVNEVLNHNYASTRGMTNSLHSHGGQHVGHDGYITADDLIMCLATTALDYVRKNTTHHKSRMELYKDLYSVLLDGKLTKRALKSKAIDRQARLFRHIKASIAA